MDLEVRQKRGGVTMTLVQTLRHNFLYEAKLSAHLRMVRKQHTNDTSLNLIWNLSNVG